MKAVPLGWRRTHLGEVLVRIEAGKSFAGEPRQAAVDEWGIIKVSAMTYGTFRDNENKAVPPNVEFSKEFEIKSGDLLISRANTRDYVGASVIVGDCRPRLLLSDKSLRLYTSAAVDRRWLWHALSSPQARLYLSEASTGVKAGMRNISQRSLRATPLLLPPLDEQRRIVDLLEDHLSRLEAADSYVAASAQKLDLLVASVLINDEALAAAERRPLKQLLSEPLANGRSVPTREGGFPVLRLTALTGNGIDLSARKNGAWGEHDARPFLVRRGDFLVSRGNGSLRLVARGGLVREEPDGVAYPDTLIRVRTDSSLVNPVYLAAVWNSPIVREQIESVARTTAGIYKVNQKHLEAVELPLPTLNEQNRVSARIEETQRVASRLGSAVRLAESRAAALRRALLAAAFSGRLTGRSIDNDLVEEMADA